MVRRSERHGGGEAVIETDSSSRNGSALPGWGRQGRAPEERLTSSSSWPPSSSSPSCHLPPHRASRGWLDLGGDSTGSPRRVSRRKYTLEGVFEPKPPYLGGGVALLANRRRLAVLATAHELLIQRHALLAHRTLLGRIGGEVAAHEAEDLLARDLRLLRAAPERPDADDLAAQLLHEIAEQLHRAPRADEILHDQNLRARADEAVELRGQGDLALARAHALGPVHEGRARRMSPSDAMGEDEGAGPGREDHIDGPLREVFGDDRPEPFREGGLGGDERLLDVLAGMLAGGKEDVVVGVIGAGALQDLQVDLLTHLRIHAGVVLRGRRGHGTPRMTVRLRPCQCQRCREPHGRLCKP